ncbi:hypothetical protein [Acuticoccus mangrovi]|uniref:Uncharacterized protein n=1 Tax=Acuticoccus mangrovi TaxID=2796142 RepID=A0A934ITV9_9HYPH|nr:hypothetical protein [Acuticoccus mangrovi]MBJ3778655.1 hypothetical protein [Acuticoccus mangrovi]
MKLFIIGIWAVCVTLGAGYAVAAWKLDSGEGVVKPRLEGLRYTSLPTMSVPVLEGGRVSGYVVARMVYTADAAVLRGLASEPDPFITDEVFRSIYGRAETRMGRLIRFDLEGLAEEARQRVNERMGDEVVQDLLVDGLNYIDLSSPDAANAVAALGGGSGAPTDAPRRVGANGETPR